MSEPSVVGPFEQIALAGGATAPWYVISFDKDGYCTSPRSREHLLRAVRGGEATHVVVFSHGWNNGWAEVEGLTGSFFKNVAALGPAQAPGGAPFRPIFVSVFWPSIALVLPEERGPRFASAAVAASDDRAVELVAAAVPARRRARVRELAARQRLAPGELEELARILAPAFARPDELGAARRPTPAELSRQWRAAAAALGGEAATEDFGFGDDGAGGAAPAGPQAAGGAIDWVRLPYRIATVWQMKDRAGVVGARGVARLLRALLAASPDARVHLVGHSYGCRVVLAAVAAEPAPVRPVESILLLQPAVSRLGFAERLPGAGAPGGYRIALERTRQPILATYSKDDWPLHTFFHIALRRPHDVGDVQAAGGEPSPYAALGGYGPGGVGALARTERPRERGQPYDLAPGGARLIALDGAGARKPDGSAVIAGHGDVNSPYTWWMLQSQVGAS